MTQPLAGRHGLITGGGGGIGTAIAHALAGQGATITVIGRDQARLDRVVDSVGGAQAIAADVSDAEAVAAAFSAARNRFGAIDILVNGAGAAASSPFDRASTAQWERMIGVNLTGTFLCCRQVLGSMMETGYGRIVNIASTAGLRGYRYVAAYCAAKHGVIGLTRSLALESAHRGVTVNAVCPGYTETVMLEETIANIVAKTGRTDDAARAALLRDTPRGSFVRAAEVASAVMWLCLPGSEAVTGQAIAVDGGESAG